MEKTPLDGGRAVLKRKIEKHKNKHLAGLRSGVCLLPVIAYSLSAGNSYAITVSVGLNPTPAFPKSSIKPKVKPSGREPIVLTAREVHYDKENSIVTASGKVEIAQGETILLADEVVYNQAENAMKARGRVSVLEAGGNVVFADNLELKDDLKAGVISQFKARLSDDSLFAASSAKKHDENITELHNAVYSPCKVCASASGGEKPLWQLRADHVTIDKAEQQVSYDDALLEIYGVPIFYTPYFSHPTPKADNKTGLLEPTFKQSTNLGTVYRQPVYYTIAEDKDVTVTPILTTLEGPVIAGEYRQAFNNGKLNLTGSITKPQTRDAGGATAKGQNFRGHFDGRGSFNIDETTDWGFDIKRTSDDTYLRRYDFSDDTLLVTRGYIEKHDFIKNDDKDDKMRSFASVEALKFDGLTADDNAKAAPVVIPFANFNWQSSPDSRFGGSFFADSNAMSLTRREGTQSHRFSNRAGWKLPYITEDGQIIEFESSVRADIYSVRDRTLTTGGNYNGQTGRLLPQAALTWHYPFIKQEENYNLLLEPVVMAAISPNIGNSDKIPDEDSQVPEFNTANLFSPNRFAGLDRIETGAQASYGLRGQANFYNSRYVDFLLGQHYRRNTDNDFPYSNDQNSHSSDYVGKLGIYYDPVSIAYRTRLNKDNLSFNQNEVQGNFNYYPINLAASYLMIKNNPTIQDKEELGGGMGINLTKQWLWGVSATRDLQLGRLSSTSTVLTFQNECVYITNSFGRNYTYDRDIKPATTYMFRVSFKNLD